MIFFDVAMELDKSVVIRNLLHYFYYQVI